MPPKVYGPDSGKLTICLNVCSDEASLPSSAQAFAWKRIGPGVQARRRKTGLR